MDAILRQIYDVEAFRQEGHAAIDRLADHLANCQNGEHSRTIPALAPDDARDFWLDVCSADADSPESLRAVTDGLLSNSVQLNSPYYMGHQIGVPAFPALITSLITDALNNGSGVYEMGMSAVAMERILIACLAETFGFPAEEFGPKASTPRNDHASGFFSSGGSLANLTALLAARARLPQETASNPARLAIMVSEQAHYCAAKAAAIMGLPPENVIQVPTDEHWKLDSRQLEPLLKAACSDGKKVFAIVGSSCTTSTGTFDDLSEIGQFAQKHNIWMHIDGAHGGAVAFSQKHRHLTNGIELADSVTIDFHKLLMTPALCSALVFRDGSASFRTFATEADYLFAQRSKSFDASALARRTFECTKNMMVAKVFTIFQQYGTQAWEANVDHLHDLTKLFQRILTDTPGFEVACEPQTNIICYRYRKNGRSARSHCEQMQAVREKIVAAERFYIVTTKIRGETWLRSTISNPFTTKEHFEELCSLIEEFAQQV